MKIYTSYFYQIRNFPVNLIPLSTAVWDPKWYHNFKDQSYIFKDKRGVIVGTRIPDFRPGTECEGLCLGPDRVDVCQQESGVFKCKFLNTYYKQLKKIDFDKMMEGLESFTRDIKKSCNSDQDFDIALIFHEAPSNPCSERVVVKQWFKDHGVDIPEFDKNRI